MHDEMLTLFDDCIDRMLQLRAHLSASRRVQPGERLAAVVSAIEVTNRFAAEAGQAVAGTGSPVLARPFATGTRHAGAASPEPAPSPDRGRSGLPLGRPVRVAAAQ